MTKISVRSVLAALVALFTSLILAACGGNGDSACGQQMYQPAVTTRIPQGFPASAQELFRAFMDLPYPYVNPQSDKVIQSGCWSVQADPFYVSRVGYRATFAVVTFDGETTYTYKAKPGYPVWIQHTTSLLGGIALTVIGAPNQGPDPAVWEHNYFINGMKVTWPSTFSDGDVSNLSVKEFGSGWLLVEAYQGQGDSLPHLSRLALYQPSTGTFIDYGYAEW